MGKLRPQEVKYNLGEVTLGERARGGIWALGSWTAERDCSHWTPLLGAFLPEKMAQLQQQESSGFSQENEGSHISVLIP